MDGGGDPVPRPAPSELAEHSTSVEHSLWPLQPESSEHPTSTPRGVVGVSYNQPVSEPTEQSKTGGNLVLKPAPSEIADQPRSGEGLSPGMDTMPRPLPVALPGVISESRCEPRSPSLVPRWRLAREGPFLAERSSSSLRSFGAGCAFRNTTYRASHYASPSGEFGIPLNHP